MQGDGNIDQEHDLPEFRLHEVVSRVEQPAANVRPSKIREAGIVPFSRSIGGLSLRVKSAFPEAFSVFSSNEPFRDFC